MPPTNEQVEAQLARLLASNTLGRSERLCRFLQFVVRHTLEGRGDELKEYAIGVEVFEKGADFDPRLDSAVRVDARRLRAKLDEYYATEGNRDPVVIRMPKGGYLPIFLDREDATVREPLTLTGEVPIAPVTGTPAHPVPATEGPSRPKWVVWGAALAVFAALIAGVLVWRSRESTEVQPGRGYVARAVAVLPFANLTGNQQNDALCDGLAEELTRRLSTIEGLRVVTRSAAFTYRARQTDARTVARELGVDTLLEGTVREGREALRITVHLVRGADAIDVWSESFDLPKGDELGAQDQIGNTIERRVAAYVPGFQPSGDDAQQQAQTLALQANHFAQRSTDENLTRAMELAKEAVKLKPDYAAAYAVLADVQLSIVPFRRSERQQLLSEVRANAGKAMSLNSNLASPLVTLATLALNYEWKWAEAEDLYRRAIALNPNQHASHARYSRLLTLKGRNNEAIQHAKQAEALAPLSIQSLSALGQAFYYARDFDQALVALERGMEIDPGYVNARYTKARIFALRGDRAQALQELDRIGKRTAESVAIRHWILTTQGKHAEAAPLLEEARKASCISYAASLLAIGRPDDAMARLEEAAAAKDPDVLYAAVSPVLESLGGTARLKKLAEKFGL